MIPFLCVALLIALISNIIAWARNDRYRHRIEDLERDNVDLENARDAFRDEVRLRIALTPRCDGQHDWHGSAGWYTCVVCGADGQPCEKCGGLCLDGCDCDDCGLVEVPDAR